MKTGYLRLAALAVLIAFMPGCGGTKSSSGGGGKGAVPVPTSEMTINLRIESTEPGTAVVRANLNNGRFFSDSYRLDGGDYFRACNSGVCQNMADNGSITSPDYIARFDFLPGVDYVVSFFRPNAQNAADSRAALPPAFTIVTPANHQQVTDGETVQVAWSPTGAPATVSLRYGADCTQASGVHVFATGTVGYDPDRDGVEAVKIDDILTVARTNTPSPITRCAIVLTVRHEIQGRIDPAFHGGSAVGAVIREVNLDYIPR